MMSNQKKYFPINTATSCQSKWTWSTIYLNEASSSSCHRVRQLPLSLEDFDNFHNLPGKIEDREFMLQGKWPQGRGCDYCQTIEESGGSSDRMYQKKIPNLTPPELELDPTAVIVTPRILEVFMDNLCNMSCVYCNPRESSKIRQENDKFGDFEFRGVKITNSQFPLNNQYRQYFSKFIQWLENNGHHLKRLHLLGGEPFFQDDLDQVLEVLSRQKNRNLELNIVSNLMIAHGRLERYIDKIKKMIVDRNIGRFDLTASIDCWGQEQEYARHGIKLNHWEKNFAFISDQKWITLHVNQTMSCMTIKTIPELIEKINFYRQKRKITQFFQFVDMWPYMRPSIFSWDTWKKDFDKILSVMPSGNWDFDEERTRMQGMASKLSMFSEHNYSEIEKLHTHLDELDRRRGTNWRQIFPYLDISRG